MDVDLLTLEINRWYLWQMLPGYGDRPYYSPIKIYAVLPRRTGSGILSLAFYNAFYAEGVRDFQLDLKVVKRTSDYMVAEIVYGGAGPHDRVAIIQPATEGRLSQVFGTWMNKLSDSEDISTYLDRITRE